MRITDRQELRLQLLAHEGPGPMRVGRHFPYRCPAGKLTIGYGRNLDDVGISVEEARELLDHDINLCLLDLATFGWFYALDPIRQMALVDMRFQLGPSGFRAFHQMLAALTDGAFDAAAAECLHSKYATTDAPARAAMIAEMLRTGQA